MNLEIYQQLCAESKILWTQHCLQRMQERDISRADVKNGIATGEIIEDYPDTKKFEDDLKTRRKRYILDVNPFNQPGVEFYKRNMFKLLGKPGYESK